MRLIIATMIGVTRYIMDYAANRESFLAADLLEEAKSLYPMSRVVLNSYLAKMVSQGKLERKGQGIYGKRNNNLFLPEPSEKTSDLYNSVKESFPFTEICVYEGLWISPLMHHLANNQANYIEVEKVASEAVFHFLQNQDKAVFYRPDRTEMDKYVYLGNAPIIVKNMVSESPLQRVRGIKIPTLEKLLVDMYCDPDFFYLQGGEYWRIMHHAHSYAINTSKMFRYATRRNAVEAIKVIWNESSDYYD